MSIDDLALLSDKLSTSTFTPMLAEDITSNVLVSSYAL